VGHADGETPRRTEDPLSGPLLPHFVMLNPLAGSPATRAAIRQAIDVLKTALA
jgi:hypothetical protein